MVREYWPEYPSIWGTTLVRDMLSVVFFSMIGGAEQASWCWLACPQTPKHHWWSSMAIWRPYNTFMWCWQPPSYPSGLNIHKSEFCNMTMPIHTQLGSLMHAYLQQHNVNYCHDSLLPQFIPHRALLGSVGQKCLRMFSKLSGDGCSTALEVAEHPPWQLPMVGPFHA